MRAETQPAATTSLGEPAIRASPARRSRTRLRWRAGSRCTSTVRTEFRFSVLRTGDSWEFRTAPTRRRGKTRLSECVAMIVQIGTISAAVRCEPIGIAYFVVADPHPGTTPGRAPSEEVLNEDAACAACTTGQPGQSDDVRFRVDREITWREAKTAFLTQLRHSCALR